VDFSFTYVTGFGRDGSYTDQYTLLKSIELIPSEEKLRTFGGHYDVTALMPAIGLSYAF
jgi:long-chain fatty acid transport protein